MEFKYFEVIKGLIEKVETEESPRMELCVDALFDCVKRKNSIYAFGASHAGILTEELFYRAGGCMLINPIFARELMLDTKPVTHTSSMERLTGYGSAVARDQVGFKEGDVLIVHSVSGRNPVGIEMAMAAKEAGGTVIAITNLSYSKSVESRHPSGKRLFEIADIVLDNHGDVGDAAVSIGGLKQKVAPTSTVIGATMLDAIVAALVQKLVDSGMKHPPVFYSANLDGGDDLNKRLFEEYKECIHYEL